MKQSHANLNQYTFRILNLSLFFKLILKLFKFGKTGITTMGQQVKH